MEVNKKGNIEDKALISARNDIEKIFSEEKERVFYSRQLEVFFENKYFHWITNKAINELVKNGIILSETRNLKTGNVIKLLWNKNYRYFKRNAKELEKLVEEFSNPAIGAAIGMHCELLVHEGISKAEFILKGREKNDLNGKIWSETEHNLDFIYFKDGIYYGVEVKNKLSYMDKDELDKKIKICRHLGIKPVFVTRMLPKTWINEINNNGGFALILKYQLYPKYLKDLADKIKENLNLPVDYPKSISDHTILRFLKWHEKYVK